MDLRHSRTSHTRTDAPRSCTHTWLMANSDDVSRDGGWCRAPGAARRLTFSFSGVICARDKKDDSREKVGLHRTAIVARPTMRKATNSGVLPADRPLGSPILYGLLPFAARQNPAESHFRETVWANRMSWSEGTGSAQPLRQKMIVNHQSSRYISFKFILSTQGTYIPS